MNIIVRMPNWIGDLVMATPVLADLRAAYPDASITAMCRRPLCELIAQDPSIDELFCFAKLTNEFTRREEQRGIIEKLRTGKYDVGILLTHSFSSAWWFWQGNVRRRIGTPRHWRRFLLTDKVEPPESEHEVISYKKILSPLGIPVSKTRPQLFVSEEEVETSKQLLYQRGYKAGKKLVGINPGAAYGSAKCWPVERFRALALELLAKDLFLVFFGDGSTAELVKEIVQGLPERAINLAGITNLRELACIIRDCDVLVTNDSGPMHIGAAFGTPLVALFGSTDDRLTGPYGQPEAVINKRPSCSPCFKRVCPIDFRCMRSIEVDEVAHKVWSLLGF
jgi:heptosyltransferase-2